MSLCLSNGSDVSDKEEEDSQGLADALRSSVAERLEDEATEVDPFQNVVMGIEVRGTSGKVDNRSEVAKLFTDVMTDDEDLILADRSLSTTYLLSYICCIVNDAVYLLTFHVRMVSQLRQLRQTNNYRVLK